MTFSKVSVQNRAASPKTRKLHAVKNGDAPLILGGAEPAKTWAIKPQGFNALAKYSVTDDLSLLKRNEVEKRPILGDLALLGQATVFYAAPNTGKTLVTLSLIIEGIEKGRFDPAMLNYINMDDDLNGLIEKTSLAKRYGFQMMSQGYKNFDFQTYLEALQEMTANDTASGVIVVVDTLTKIVDTTDVRASRHFSGIVRDFVLKGGTFIGLGHTNKRKGADGKVEYAGAATLVNDFDRIWTIQEFAERVDKDEVTVIFENVKNRGGNIPNAAYSYSVVPGISYGKKLASVCAVHADKCVSMRQVVALIPDAPVIAVIEELIGAGITQKTMLAHEAAEVANVPVRQVTGVLEKYAGSDLAKHRWTTSRGARGVYIFSLLVEAAAQELPMLKAA